jgi:transcriptional regulator with XRE-family HTH domain
MCYKYIISPIKILEVLKMSLKRVTTIGARITAALNGRTYEEIGDPLGLSKQAISSYVTGERNPRKLTIKAMAELLSVNECWLMGYDVPKEREIKIEKPAAPEWDDEQAQENIELFNQLSGEDKEDVLRYLRLRVAMKKDER